MNTDLKQTNRSSLAARLLRRRGVPVLAVALVAAAAFAAWSRWFSPEDPARNLAFFEAARGPLTISITESGTIQNRAVAVVKSELEGRTTILSLIPEGNHVEKGQLLVELDSSRLVDDKVQQQIAVLNAEAAFIRARENLLVAQSQTESDIGKAELDYKFAELDRKKYLEGDYPQELDKARAEITIATRELTRAQEMVQWSRTLREEGYITEMDLKADEIDATKRDLELKLAEGRRKLLEEYTYRRTVEELNSNVEQTKAALERVKRKATADIVQAEAELKARDSEFNRQKAKLEKIDQQIGKCRITAPVAGMVVYATTGQMSRRGSTEPLDEGQEVRERQELIHLPVTTSMKAELKIHESSLTKVTLDLPVRVTVDAVPGKTFSGRVGKIALLPDAQSIWMNPDLKVYDTEVYLDGDAQGLRAGMTCRAEIVVARYDDAVYVPVQSVVRVQGKPTVYVARDGEAAVPREVQIGLDNNRMIRVLAGVEKGERVLLRPPLSPSTAPVVPEQAEVPAAPPPPPAPGELQGPPAASAGQQSAAESMGEQPTKQPEVDATKLRSMSREERRKYFESLPAEQREEMMKKRGSRTGGRGGRGEPAPPPPPDQGP